MFERLRSVVPSPRNVDSDAADGRAEDITVGVLSDTHGSLDDKILQEFEGVSLIVHAGDVGHGVLDRLELIAPVRAVSGNTDRFPPEMLPEVDDFEYEGLRFYVRHIVGLGDSRIPEGADLVIAGHTHRPEVRDMGSYLYLNPGSAAASRCPDGTESAAIVTLGNDGPKVRILYLE